MTSEKKFGRKWTWPKVKILVKYLAESGIWPKVVFGRKWYLAKSILVFGRKWNSPDFLWLSCSGQNLGTLDNPI